MLESLSVFESSWDISNAGFAANNDAYCSADSTKKPDKLTVSSKPEHILELVFIESLLFAVFSDHEH